MVSTSKLNEIKSFVNEVQFLGGGDSWCEADQKHNDDTITTLMGYLCLLIESEDTNRTEGTMKKPTLANGTRVMVYEDPVTRKKPEGMATIVGKVDHGDQYYEVRFDSEPESTYHRFIRT